MNTMFSEPIICMKLVTASSAHNIHEIAELPLRNFTATAFDEAKVFPCATILSTWLFTLLVQVVLFRKASTTSPNCPVPRWPWIFKSLWFNAQDSPTLDRLAAYYIGKYI